MDFNEYRTAHLMTEIGETELRLTLALGELDRSVLQQKADHERFEDAMAQV